MDNYYEQIVVKKNKVFNNVFYILAFVFLVVFAVIGIVGIQGVFYHFTLINLFIALIFIGLAVVIYLYKDQIKTDYEYTLINGEIDFAKVFNNAKRKNLGTMNLKNISSFGSVNSDHFKRIISNPSIKRLNWFLNRENNLYFIYFEKDSNKKVLIFEPDQEMIDLIKKYIPYGSYNE